MVSRTGIDGLRRSKRKLTRARGNTKPSPERMKSQLAVPFPATSRPGGCKSTPQNHGARHGHCLTSRGVYSSDLPKPYLFRKKALLYNRIEPIDGKTAHFKRCCRHGVCSKRRCRACLIQSTTPAATKDRWVRTRAPRRQRNM